MGKLTTLKPKVATLDTRTTAPAGARTVVGRASQTRREEVAWRAGYECAKCGLLTSLKQGDADHITPLHMGGSDSINNMQWLCKQCHKEKSDAEEKGRGGKS